MRRLTIPTVLLVLSVSCAPKVRVTSEAEPGVDFSTFTTYALAQPSDADPIVAQKVQAEIGRVLEEKGLRPAASEDADLVVAFRGSRAPTTRRTLSSNPTANYFVVEDYIEGTLVITVFDRDRRRRIWQGVGAIDIRREEDVQKAAHRAVDAVLAGFPPET
jgi:hypothetical protein